MRDSTPLSVLTVDDEPHIHSGLDAIIDWQAYGCEHAAFALDGTEALAIIEARRPDIVITDIRMPGMDGLELIRRVRGMDGYAPAVILVTGYDEFEYARTALRFGVQDYLLKPIEEEELTRLLTAIRERGRRGSPDEGAHDALVVRSVTRRLVVSQPTPETVAAAERLLGIPESEHLSYVVAVPLAPPDSTGAAWSTSAVADVIRTTAFREAADRVFQEPGDALGCLLSIPRAGRERAAGDTRMKGLYHTLSNRLGLPLVVVGGDVVTCASSAWQSRERALSVAEAHYLMTSPGYHLSTSPRSGDTPLGRIPGDTIDKILDAIERTNVDAATAMIDSVFDTLTTRPVASAALRNWLYTLQAELNRIVWDLDGTVRDEIGSIGALSEHIALRPAYEVRSALETAVAMTTRQVAELRQLGRHSVVRLVKRRVDRSFADQLSLAELAEEYGLNSVYLGQLFRQTIGSSFRTYLRATRVREAQRLLEGTELRVPEVGEAVGYQDPDYFVEQFRREAGVNPSTYRAQRTERQDET